MGKRVGVERGARVHAILLVIIPKVQHGEVEVFSSGPS